MRADCVSSHILALIFNLFYLLECSKRLAWFLQGKAVTIVAAQWGSNSQLRLDYCLASKFQSCWFGQVRVLLRGRGEFLALLPVVPCLAARYLLSCVPPIKNALSATLCIISRSSWSVTCLLLWIMFLDCLWFIAGQVSPSRPRKAAERVAYWFKRYSRHALVPSYICYLLRRSRWGHAAVLLFHHAVHTAGDAHSL